ncbi:MAG TPA: type II toxin-antitoxin system prevent-host-death family antitoxin [Polyangiaceae bacterium]|jgi:prevent-host-death family protein|nr:type II toxin-antitoxin system prevent-host-death family antitoxin [Polyangiaceae bacterium]
MNVSVYAAKTHLSRLLDRAARGEEVIITRSGRPVAKLVPAGAASGPRKLGALKGRIRVRKDFDTLPEEVLASFEGTK